MNFLDRCIGAISPKWGVSRQFYRTSLRNYDAAGRDRLNANWASVNNTAELTDRSHRDVIRARARDLERNSDISEGIVNAFERNVIGTGITIQARVTDSQGNEDDKINNKIEKLFKDWCHKENCDITGQMSFMEIQAMLIRRLIVDGGMIFIKCYNSDGIVPFCLQAKEVDDLDSSRDTVSVGNLKTKVVGGIELNEYNKPVAYHFKRYTVDGYYLGDSERVTADRVIFPWKKNRPTQIREISPMAKTLSRVKDVNEFVEAVSVKERILACLSVFITKQTPTTPGRGGAVDDKSGYKVRNISPGMIHELQPGEGIDAVNPAGQSSNAKDFVTMQQRMAGAGQGLGYETTSRDMSQVNYSSARQGLLEDQITYKKWQDFIIEHFCREVYTEFVKSAVLCGKLDIRDFFKDKEKYLDHAWVRPGWSWIDPLKEVKANQFAIDSGMDTLSNICGSRGLDWKEVLEQRGKEIEYAKAVGIIKEEGGDLVAKKNTASITSTK